MFNIIANRRNMVNNVLFTWTMGSSKSILCECNGLELNPNEPITPISPILTVTPMIQSMRAASQSQKLPPLQQHTTNNRHRRQAVSSNAWKMALAMQALSLFSITTFFLPLSTLSILPAVEAHGYLKSPRSRNVVAYQDKVWDMPSASDPKPEDCPHCLNRGGTLSQCGITSGVDATTFEKVTRNYDIPQNNFGDAMPFNIQGTYVEGQVIEVEVLVTTHHKGHFVFSACPVVASSVLDSTQSTESSKPPPKSMEDVAIPTAECFSKHRLTFVEDMIYGAPPDPSYPERAYIAPATVASWVNNPSSEDPVLGARYIMKFQLPEGLNGDVVLLQWYYLTANSCKHEGYAEYPFPEAWGADGKLNTRLPDCDHVPEDGNGVPEQFWNCAEIKIEPKPPEPPETVALSDSGATVGTLTADPQKTPTESMQTLSISTDSIDEPAAIVCPQSTSNYYAAAEDCAGYVCCVDGVPDDFVLPCAHGLLFNERIQMCTWPEQFLCEPVVFDAPTEEEIEEDEGSLLHDMVEVSSDLEASDAATGENQPVANTEPEVSTMGLMSSTSEVQVTESTKAQNNGEMADGFATFSSLTPFKKQKTTTIILSPTDNVVVKRSSRNENFYGSSKELVFGGRPSIDILIRFDLSEIDDSASVESATLELYPLTDINAGGNIYAVAGDWSEKSINWRNAPEDYAPGKTKSRIRRKGKKKKWMDFDFTKAIEWSVSNKQSHVTVRIKTKKKIEGSFASKEFKGGRFAPKLTVEIGPESSGTVQNPDRPPRPNKPAKPPKPAESPDSKPGSKPSPKPPSPPSPTPPATPTAKRVLDILKTNNKKIDNELFLYESPGGSLEPSTVYKYEDLAKGLEVMNTKGIAGMYYYLGDNSANGYKYGLTNIAAFLAQSMKETIKYDACDENSWDLVDGSYPLSNSCGQLAQSYQDYKCPKGEEHMECPVDPNMAITAVTHAKWYGAPAPLFCGPKKNKDDFTGKWDHSMECNQAWANPPKTCDVYEGQKAGGFDNSAPFANSGGRTDVEGCCWWGRGVIQTTGICNFGKLNYYLGKKAADDGRDAAYPKIDFCKDPEIICSSKENKELKWIAGMFYWMESVQKYDVRGWNYMDELHSFVDGGFSDISFINAVSGIVNRGCHDPPCGTGAVDGTMERAGNFEKALKTFDL